jgi:hypothetical protein
VADHVCADGRLRDSESELEEPVKACQPKPTPMRSIEDIELMP